MWTFGEAGYDGMVIQSTRSRNARAAWMFSCSIARMDGVLRKILIPSDAATANRSAGIEAEKTKDSTLMC